MTDPEVTTLAAEGDPDAHEGPGGGLANFLYPEPAARDSLSIIKWWEKRRVPYNLFVGGVASQRCACFGSIPYCCRRATH